MYVNLQCKYIITIYCFSYHTYGRGPTLRLKVKFYNKNAKRKYGQSGEKCSGQDPELKTEDKANKEKTGKEIKTKTKCSSKKMVGAVKIALK